MLRGLAARRGMYLSLTAIVVLTTIVVGCVFTTTPSPSPSPVAVSTPSPEPTSTVTQARVQSTPAPAPIPSPTPTRSPTPRPTSTPVPAVAEASPEFDETDCRRFGVTSGSRFTCGFLTVPEDQNEPGGPTIRIAAAIAHSESDNRAPDPVVYVAGGFEGDAVRSLEGLVEEHLATYLQDRDVIVFDNRGAGLSEPVLKCTQTSGDSDYGEYVVIGLTAERLSTLEACRQELLGEGIDLSLYSVDHSAADVHDLMTALGYEVWNLYAVADGTHLAFAVTRDYPESVLSVVLDSAFALPGDSSTTDAQADGVDVPTLVIVGEFDSAASSSWRQFLADRLSTIYVVEFPGVGPAVGRGRDCPQGLAASFFQDPSARPDLGCVVSMTRSIILAEEPAPETEAEITFTTVEDTDAGFVGIVPEGWQEITPGFFAGAESDELGMMQTALPFTSLEQVLGMMQLQMSLPDSPTPTGTLKANGLTWQLFEAEGLGLSLNVALAELDGVTYAVILQDPGAEGSQFYDQVFLPAVDAFTPRP